MKAEAILAIPENQPERLFPNNEDEAKRIYRDLAREWHTDRNKSPKAQDVFSHLSKLYDLVIDRIKNNTWTLPNVIVVKGVDGKERSIKYRRKHAFELGEFAYGDRVICYVVKPEYKDLFGQYLESAKHGFRYGNDDMKKEIERYLPSILDNFETTKGEHVVVLAKTPDVFLLKDVLDFHKGEMHPKHVAWVMSSLYNLCCYLGYSGLTHNALSETTCFVSPQCHSVMIYGGWWYSRRIGSKLNALPKLSVETATQDMLKSRVADYGLDLRLVRQLGLTLLGDPTGTAIIHTDKAPKPMLDFLRGVTHGDAKQDYANWEKARDKSFNKRRFVEMKVEASDIYKE